MPVDIAILLIAIGLIAGTLGSLVGFGGGFIIVPLTTLFLPMPARIIAGTSTAVIVINSLISTWVYQKQRRIDVKSALCFAVAAIPGSFIGAHLDKGLSAQTFDLWFGILLIVATVLLVFKPKHARKALFGATTKRSLTDAQGNHFEYSFNLPIGIAAAFCMGFISSLFGIGGGTIMVPVMILVLGFPPHFAAATSMMMVLVSSIVGTVSHALQGNVHWSYALFLAIGAYFGGQLGPRLSAKLSGPWLVRVVAVLMTITAIRLIA